MYIVDLFLVKIKIGLVKIMKNILLIGIRNDIGITLINLGNKGVEEQVNTI
jgi:hypothetical protein